MDKPSVLFICVKNAGKSQMAAALMRHFYGDSITVYSAGTTPGKTLNSESETSVGELGATFEGEYPKAIDVEVLRNADAVVIIGKEAQVEGVPGQKSLIQRWDTDEPSLRGIEGEERMNLIRDELRARIVDLAKELLESE
ncbi:arsenate-mycothiol transferase ArsC [Arcanobacterium ihumii]|uniref:arsenate-mycothiol transferase ArsC n=1 Tax=Arcanobacterium ihumii TaxID=2138162 RepID=UPI00190F3BA8|nr:low molecular weight phosphatase family protein [Arcanobacterium ihumii]